MFEFRGIFLGYFWKMCSCANEFIFIATLATKFKNFAFEKKFGVKWRTDMENLKKIS